MGTREEQLYCDAVERMRSYNADNSVNHHPCRVCGKVDAEKPAAFRGEDWCCENHRKVVQKDPPKKRY